MANYKIVSYTKSSLIVPNVVEEDVPGRTPFEERMKALHQINVWLNTDALHCVVGSYEFSLLYEHLQIVGHDEKVLKKRAKLCVLISEAHGVHVSEPESFSGVLEIYRSLLEATACADTQDPEDDQQSVDCAVVEYDSPPVTDTCIETVGAMSNASVEADKLTVWLKCLLLVNKEAADAYSLIHFKCVLDEDYAYERGFCYLRYMNIDAQRNLLMRLNLKPHMDVKLYDEITAVVKAEDFVEFVYALVDGRTLHVDDHDTGNGAIKFSARIHWYTLREIFTEREVLPAVEVADTPRATEKVLRLIYPDGIVRVAPSITARTSTYTADLSAECVASDTFYQLIMRCVDIAEKYHLSVRACTSTLLRLPRVGHAFKNSQNLPEEDWRTLSSQIPKVFNTLHNHVGALSDFQKLVDEKGLQRYFVANY